MKKFFPAWSLDIESVQNVCNNAHILRKDSLFNIFKALSPIF